MFWANPHASIHSQTKQKYPTCDGRDDGEELALPAPPPPPEAGENDEQREDCELILRLSLSAI